MTCTTTTHWLDTTGAITTCAAVSAVDNCIDYELTTGICKECARSSHYWDGSACVAPATLIEGCASYDIEDSSCYQCASTHYAGNGSDSECLTVVNSISNCIEYAEGVNCASCALGYFKSGGNCFAISASNCSENNRSADDCTECDTLFKKGSASPNLSCIANGVARCVDSNGALTDSTCLECENLYYPFNNVCTAITASVNCTTSNGVSNDC
ncbi:MAG: hypothetical protein JKY09_00485 [Crocinitomicaceae bacterium]|nr:hypothetical protein [Crocinitomicaceae bacterium]